ncbi:hypothetical protein BDV29DRAFT_154294 [Aspergillus leporis]|uniref:CFEM domain-containing protein n=1 Tax=Aspergillus leporis TaxID=41062 RepID=A0A5N5XCI3_9EURO|nr:hypothetical protein BDV29DRAFT_154294 [Aspergillus leporis]
MKFTFTISLSALVATVIAQQPTPCLKTCIQEAGICLGINPSCFCDNQEFRKKMAKCIDGCDDETKEVTKVLDLALCG